MRKYLYIFSVCLLLGAQLCSGQSTVLAKTTALVNSNKLGVTFPVLAPGTGWQFVQDLTNIVGCSLPSSTCSITYGVPTTAGSIWAMCAVIGDTGLTVSSFSLTGGGGAWTYLTSYEAPQPGGGANIECGYNLTGNSGSTAPTVTLSGSASVYLQVLFFELLPPTGYTASFDAAAVTQISAANGCTACQLANIPITATDAVIIQLGSGQPFANLPFFVSSPYIADLNQQAIGLNITNGVGPIAYQTPAGSYSAVAVAFKSTAGSFSIASNQTLVNAAGNGHTGSGSTCNSPCALTIPSTTAGNLGTLWVSSLTGASNLTAISDGTSTYTVPASCQVNVTTVYPMYSNCGYSLSLAGGKTSITLTMSQSTTTIGWLWQEFNKSNGNWAFDNANTLIYSAPGSSIEQCPTLTLNGNDDTILQFGSQQGAPSIVTPNFYPWGFLGGNWGYAVLQGNSSAGSVTDVSTYNRCSWETGQTGSSNPFSMAVIAFH